MSKQKLNFYQQRKASFTSRIKIKAREKIIKNERDRCQLVYTFGTAKQMNVVFFCVCRYFVKIIEETQILQDLRVKSEGKLGRMGREELLRQVRGSKRLTLKYFVEAYTIGEICFDFTVGRPPGYFFFENFFN